MVLIASVVEVRLAVIFGWGGFQLDVILSFLGLPSLISDLFGRGSGLCLFFVTSWDDRLISQGRSFGLDLDGGLSWCSRDIRLILLKSLLAPGGDLGLGSCPCLS